MLIQPRERGAMEQSAPMVLHLHGEWEQRPLVAYTEAKAVRTWPLAPEFIFSVCVHGS